MWATGAWLFFVVVVTVFMALCTKSLNFPNQAEQTEFLIVVLRLKQLVMHLLFN
jgi:hypothetical protein